MPQAPQQQKKGTGFVGLSDYVRANQDNVGHDTQALLNPVTAQADAAKQEADAFRTSTLPGQDATQDAGYQDALGAQTAAQKSLDALKTQGGVAVGLQNAYGKNPGGYSQAENFLDTELQGQSTGSQAALKATQDKYGGLSSYVQNRAKALQDQNQETADHQAQPTPTDSSAPEDKPERDNTHVDRGNGTDRGKPSRPWSGGYGGDPTPATGLPSNKGDGAISQSGSSTNPFADNKRRPDTGWGAF